MSILTTTFMVLALTLLNTKAQDVCLEVFSITDIALNRLKLDFLASSFDLLEHDLNNTQRVSGAIQSACTSINVSIPETTDKDPCSCSVVKSTITDLLANYTYGTANEEEGQMNVVFIIEQMLSFSNDIERGSCIDEWVTQLTNTDSDTAVSSIESETENQEEENQDSLTTSWWLDRNSYLNTHVDELITDLEIILQFSAKAAESDGEINQEEESGNTKQIDDTNDEEEEDNN